MKTSQQQGLGVWTPMPLTVFLIGLCISGAGAMWLARDNDAKVRKEFDGHVQRLVNDVSRRFREPVYGLNGIRGMYVASRQVPRAAFRAYVESRDLPREFPGVRGFGFVQHVARDALAPFIATERADGAPEFGIHSLGAATRDDPYIIKFIEPAEGNQIAVGLDLGSDALRREGIERAIRTGEATLTAPISLVLDIHQSPGFLLFVPVFRHGIAAATPARRRARLEGLLFAPIVAAELLRGATEVTDGMTNFDLSDTAGATSSTAFVFASDASAKTGRLTTTHALNVHGREFTLRARSTAQFDAKMSTTAPELLFLAGGLISAWLAALIWRQIALRRHTEGVASGMTTDLEHFAQVVRHTSTFSQADESITRKFDCTELGRSISTELVEHMGGPMSVDGEVGAGSSFHFRIPLPVVEQGSTTPALLHELANASSVAPGASGSGPLHGNVTRYVLLVDDIAVNRMLAVRMLESLGHVVAVATNGIEAVQLCARENVDLILMDLQMPVMDGFQTAEKIRQIEAAGARHTPIVAMTAHALHDEKQRCLDAGMVGQVSKPLSKQALHTAVQQYALPRAVEEMPALPIRGHIGTPAKATTASLVPEPATLPMPSLKSRPLRDDTAALDRLGGDRELLDELIEMYLQSLEPQSAELRRTGASKDLAKLGQLAHSQKGSAGAVGANDARSAASALEISCNEGDEAAAMCWLEELLDALQALREEADMKTAP